MAWRSTKPSWSTDEAARGNLAGNVSALGFSCGRGYDAARQAERVVMAVAVTKGDGQAESG